MYVSVGQFVYIGACTSMDEELKEHVPDCALQWWPQRKDRQRDK